MNKGQKILVLGIIFLIFFSAIVLFVSKLIFKEVLVLEIGKKSNLEIRESYDNLDERKKQNLKKIIEKLTHYKIPLDSILNSLQNSTNNYLNMVKNYRKTKEYELKLPSDIDSLDKNLDILLEERYLLVVDYENKSRVFFLELRKKIKSMSPSSVNQVFCYLYNHPAILKNKFSELSSSQRASISKFINDSIVKIKTNSSSILLPHIKFLKAIRDKFSNENSRASMGNFFFEVMPLSKLNILLNEFLELNKTDYKFFKLRYSYYFLPREDNMIMGSDCYKRIEYAF